MTTHVVFRLCSIDSNCNYQKGSLYPDTNHLMWCNMMFYPVNSRIQCSFTTYYSRCIIVLIKLILKIKSRKSARRNQGGVGRRRECFSLIFSHGTPKKPPWQTGYKFMDFTPFHQMVKVRKLEFQCFMNYISDHLGWFGIIWDKSGAF